MQSVLVSPQLGQGLVPVVAFAGGTAASPTDPAGTPQATPAGSFSVQYDLPDDGLFGGEVIVNRPSVVMLKATYDPRWHVTVDDKPAKTQMIAPAYLGVAVGPGKHRIAFEYVPFAYYWVLLLLGGLTLLVLALLPRYAARVAARRNAAVTPATPPVEPRSPVEAAASGS